MGAQRQEKDGIKYIYALGRELGLSDPALGHDDDLHVLVEGVTGCSSIKALSEAEKEAVIHELLRRKAAAAPETLHKRNTPRRYNETPGRMTVKHQKYAWFLMSDLEKYDPAPDGVALRYRLSGLITKQFRMTSFPEDPFRFLTRAQGAALINGLKRMAEEAELEYLRSEKGRKAAAAGGPERQLSGTGGGDRNRRLHPDR